MLRKDLMSAGSMMKNTVRNYQGEDVGRIEEIMIDVTTGEIAYAVLSFGGFLNMGSKYFAIPWQTLILDKEDEVFKLDVTEEKLKHSPGFDKDDWPNFADPSFLDSVNRYYGDGINSVYDSSHH